MFFFNQVKSQLQSQSAIYVTDKCNVDYACEDNNTKCLSRKLHG